MSKGMRRDPVIRGEDVPEKTGHREARTKQVSTFFTPAEVAMWDYLVEKRRCRSRGDYVRLMLEADARGDLLIVDDAMHKIADKVARSFAGAVGELAAQAELHALRMGMEGR